MITIDKELISYQSMETGRSMTHHVLIANALGKRILLSHVNLFLSEHGTSSVETSNRYSGVISKFYKYISTQSKYRDLHVGQYHVVADNRDIKRWQIDRQIKRINRQSTKPSSATIYAEAKTLLTFFNWITESGYITNVSVKKKTWRANFKSEHMLNYVMRQSSEKIDGKNITVLDKESRQKKSKSLITNSEIKLLIQSYHDPVYSAMFKLALGTAMRPMDICRFPYLGNGRNRHIMPFSDMRELKTSTVDYTISGSKGNKSRTIKINKADLKALDEYYIKPHYFERVAKYEERYGEKCPPSVLFLTERGIPVTPPRIASRTTDAKKAIQEKNPNFRDSVTFYDARHWWPTMFLIKFFGDRLLTESADALYAAASEALINQMGHEDISTTYKYYVDMARVIMMSNQGYVAEIITEDDESVMDFIERSDSN
ncbi:DNA breaking-rejoining enzyme [Vibrio parahaemolyticus]|uniref:site-specific integrase n=1 Tax=Vibrio harveyi group TaxID=717610 RepID=UPI0006A6DE27|nr:site-specific integrase [Vibrio parahaemolyticus]EKB1970471.1 site-specific integrase [Vibrio parahaemolyticus]KOF50698.1 DNA breaking-rejoining enzyme [Vibrio parahaemolyticus]MCS0006341.1 site-specific integrase [Vibrio parahaemolyticus]MCS0041658.1 site-specific integrase [Vibrio parahaemolyticus]